MNKPRRAAVVTGLAVSIAAASLAPAAVASSDGSTHPHRARTVHVSGEQIPVDLATGKYVMRGDLIGDWLYIPRTPPLHSSKTLYVEAGTEVFKGCIDRNGNGRCGRRDYRGELRLAFIYWASFDQNGKLVRGQCVHPITGGRGAFAGARGVLYMVDRPEGNQVKTTYRGDVELNAVPAEGEAAVAASPAATTTSSSGSSGRGC